MNQVVEDAVKELVTIFLQRAQVSTEEPAPVVITENSCKFLSLLIMGCAYKTF